MNKLMRSFVGLVLVSIILINVCGCVMNPGGIAPSTTPINGRKYKNLGRVANTDSRIYLFGFIPVSGANTIRNAVDQAVASRNGDAMINVSVESYTQFWIILTRFVTRVDGDVIRFDPPAEE